MTQPGPVLLLDWQTLRITCQIRQGVLNQSRKKNGKNKYLLIINKNKTLQKLKHKDKVEVADFLWLR